MVSSEISLSPTIEQEDEYLSLKEMRFSWYFL